MFLKLLFKFEIVRQESVRMEHKPIAPYLEPPLMPFPLLGFVQEEISPGRSINKHRLRLFARGYRGGRCAREL